MAHKMTQSEMKEFLSDQCEEIMKYKWDLGVQLQHDPLQDRSLNEIGCEWTQKFAGRYRKEWEERHGIK